MGLSFMDARFESQSRPCGGSRELLSKRGFLGWNWPETGAPRTAGVSDPTPRVPRASPRPPGHCVSEVRKWGFLKTDKPETATRSRSQPTTRHRPRIETRSCALPINCGTGRLFRRLTASAARSLRPRFCAATCAPSWNTLELRRIGLIPGCRGRPRSQ